MPVITTYYFVVAPNSGLKALAAQFDCNPWFSRPTIWTLRHPFEHDDELIEERLAEALKLHVLARLQTAMTEDGEERRFIGSHGFEAWQAEIRERAKALATQLVGHRPLTSGRFDELWSMTFAGTKTFDGDADHRLPLTSMRAVEGSLETNQRAPWLARIEAHEARRLMLPEAIGIALNALASEFPELAADRRCRLSVRRNWDETPDPRNLDGTGWTADFAAPLALLIEHWSDWHRHIEMTFIARGTITRQEGRGQIFVHLSEGNLSPTSAEIIRTVRKTIAAKSQP